jgi:hypothetical protein
MPQKPKDITAGIGPTEGSWEEIRKGEYDKSKNKIDTFLNKKSEPSWAESLASTFFKMPKKKPEVSGPERTYLFDNQGRAALDMLDMYPEAAKRVRGVYLGEDLGDDTRGLFNSLTNNIMLSKKSRSYPETVDIMRHELGHAQGLPDYGKPSAYDLSNASEYMRLNSPWVPRRDIYLPPESFKGIGPTTQVKKK